MFQKFVLLQVNCWVRYEALKVRSKTHIHGAPPRPCYVACIHDNLRFVAQRAVYPSSQNPRRTTIQPMTDIRSLGLVVKR